MTPFKKLTSLNLAAATLATLLSLPQTAHAQYEAGSKKALPPSKKSEVEKPAPVKSQPQKPAPQKPAPQKPEPKKPVAQIPPKKGSPDFSDYTLKVGEKVYDRDTQSDVEITRILSDGTLYYKYLDGAYADTFKHQELAEFRFAKDHKCLNGLSVGEKLYDTDTQSDVEITRIGKEHAAIKGVDDGFEFALVGRMPLAIEGAQYN